MSIKNVNELLNSCVALRSLNTKVRKFGRGTVMLGSAEAKALEKAIESLDGRLKDGYKKSLKLSGTPKSEFITANSVSVNKMRTKERLRSYRQIEAYFKLTGDYDDGEGISGSPTGLDQTEQAGGR